MADFASDCSSGECGSDVDWMKLPSELWLEIFSYLSPVTILNVVSFVCRKFKSLSFHLSLWTEMDVTKWVGPIINLDSFIENLSSMIYRVSEQLRSLSFCQFTGNFVFGSDKRWLFYNFSNIVHLEFPECDYVTAQILEEIRQNFTKIEALILGGCRSIVNLVSKQTKIEFLVLSGRNLTNYSVTEACLRLANLKIYYIYDCKSLTDRSIYALCGKVNLECLYLQRATKVSPQAFHHLFQEKHLMNLTALSICFTDAVLDETVDAIISGCPHLESIDLNFCSKVTDKSIDKLMKSCRKVEVVCLHGLTNLEGDWVAEIDHYLPKLHCLGLACCTGISKDKVKHLLLRKPDLTVFCNSTPIDELEKIRDISRVLRNITLADFE
ncbi:unnamed protein product [Clavelina lepadiformis]|uniref:F-box domain-containing protein n=1 Tax=Clavelina lepadiformis TaxID=159417 RepID=A0ABP0FCJ2_CLALP